MPTLTVVAGPNGSGKSTLTKLGREAFQDSPVLDPDAIARRQSIMGDASSAMDAGRQVLLLAESFLSKQETFLVETTLSGKTYLRMMTRAKAVGYHLVLLFVGTTDIVINLERVRARVLRGGHNVPVEDQIRRYPRSMLNLVAALRLADEAIVFDNSGASHVKVAVKDADGITLFEPLPEWAEWMRDADQQIHRPL